MSSVQSYAGASCRLTFLPSAAAALASLGLPRRRGGERAAGGLGFGGGTSSGTNASGYGAGGGGALNSATYGFGGYSIIIFEAY